MGTKYLEIARYAITMFNHEVNQQMNNLYKYEIIKTAMTDNLTILKEKLDQAVISDLTFDDVCLMQALAKIGQTICCQVPYFDWEIGEEHGVCSTGQEHRKELPFTAHDKISEFLLD